jgi:hypothetical protein
LSYVFLTSNHGSNYLRKLRRRYLTDRHQLWTKLVEKSALVTNIDQNDPERRILLESVAHNARWLVILHPDHHDVGMGLIGSQKHFDMVLDATHDHVGFFGQGSPKGLLKFIGKMCQ